MYRNSEGYSDPTAGAAMGNIMRDYRQQRKQERQHERDLKNRPKVYVVSRYAGDIETNIAAAKSYCQLVVRKKRIPVASHLLYPQFLDDSIPEQREIGTMCGLALLACCDEVWCFGTTHSAGMVKELAEARRLNKPVRHFTENMEEIR